MVKIISREMLQPEQPKPFATFEQGVKLDEHVKLKPDGKDRTVVEFVGTGDFSSAWYERQRYEVDAGRDQEPILYRSIYTEYNDPNLPRTVTVYRVGPGAVVFEEVLEGGEVKFSTMEASDYSVRIRHYGTALEYTKDMMMYNELWNIALAERQGGIALNALLNHVHLYPFINFSYTGANQTPASSDGTTLIEKYARTFENAITNAKTDTNNPRRGRYAVLCSAANRVMISRMLTRVNQEGFDSQSDVLINSIQSVIEYDGWTGRRGNFTTTYPGVTPGKAYLIDLGQRDRNFGSYIKQSLDATTGNPDVSRFILEQTVWDTYFGAYADVEASTEEITLPS